MGAGGVVHGLEGEEVVGWRRERDAVEELVVVEVVEVRVWYRSGRSGRRHVVRI